MREPTLDDAARALEAAFNEEEDYATIDGVPVTREEYVRRRDGGAYSISSLKAEPVVSSPARIGRAQEEREYAEFSRMLGIEDDEPPVRMVTVSVEQLDEWKAQRALLDDMMRQRPENISEAEQAEYEQFLALIGPL